MVTRQRELLWHAARLAALLLMALLGLYDLHAGLLEGPGVVGVPLAVAGAAVWLLPYAGPGRGRPLAAVLVAGASFVTTAASLYLGVSGGVSYGLAETLALYGILYVVVRRSEPHWVVLAVIPLGLAIGVLPLRSGQGELGIIIGLVQGLVATGVIGTALYVRIIEGNRKRVLDAVRAEQRAEFARDLHDFIAHHVTGIVVQAQGARYVAEQDPKLALEALERIEAAGAETMASMRRMVGVLRDPQADPDAPLAPLAGVDELGRLVEQFTAAGGPLARLHVDGDTGGLPVEVSTSAYRVVMEALTNVRRHATTARVADVWVRRAPGWLLVRVANDGLPTGAPPQKPSGYGLVGLQERVRTVGGRITAGPGIDGGWIVDAALPVPS